MKKVILLLMFVLVLLVGCNSKRYPAEIEANGQLNENKINYNKLVRAIDQSNFNQARETIYKMEQRYPNDYMLNRISNQVEHYLSADYNFHYNRDWEATLKDVDIVEENVGSKKLIKDAKELRKQIDVTKKTYDGHSTERERMFQAGATPENIDKVSDQEVNNIQKLSKNKGQPEPHKGEYLFIQTMAEEHPELNMSIKKYEEYWGKE
ncbi:hypothetical protein [Enterococcus sp. AZ192]|uniref:hypothetical protein n=1 Tax=unclassified Enterococcus TaxID=2608891 RepID=UPI003D2ABD08